MCYAPFSSQEVVFPSAKLALKCRSSSALLRSLYPPKYKRANGFTPFGKVYCYLRAQAVGN